MFSTILLQANTNEWIQSLLLPAALVVMYLFMIRPQLRRQKNEKKFHTAIAKGTKVITSSGIHGKIVELNNDGTLLIETGAGKIRFERSAISMDLTNKLNAPKK
jgi:preprotein translocase subunit YajC